MVARWLLAFSGGPDSTGLAALERDRRPLLAYVDHRMRGRAAQRGERADVVRIAESLGLSLVRTRVEVEGRGEAEARRARYEALEALARRHDCNAIVLAHSADDRAETILFQLLRGSGLRGLVGIRPDVTLHGVRRHRPALARRRAELHAAAAPFGPVSDRTNRSTGTARGRTRHLLLPALAEVIGADPVPLLCELGDHAGRVRTALEQRANSRAAMATRPMLLAEPDATFAYLVEALRGEGPPLTRAAYAALRSYLAAGRGDRAHTTPGGEAWQVRPGGQFEIRSPNPRPAR